MNTSDAHRAWPARADSDAELLGSFPEVASGAELQACHGLCLDAPLGPEAHRRWAGILAATPESHGFVADP